MNYGISVLFRAIPLIMALFCFGYGTFIYVLGDDPNRLVAGPVVFSLGMIVLHFLQRRPLSYARLFIRMDETPNMLCQLSVIWLLWLPLFPV